MNPPHFIHLLNPDTYIHPGAVTKLIDFMLANPLVGIAGSRLEDPDGNPQSAAFRFHGILSELERGARFGLLTRMLNRWMVAPPPRSEAHPTQWVSGASMMVRKEVFEKIGLLDEEFFLYYEETDFCMRAYRAGFPCWYCPTSRVVHLEGQSTQANGALRKLKRTPKYLFESRRRYFRKHHGRFYEFLANLAFLAGYGTWRLRRFLQRKPDPDAPKLFTDFLRYTFSR